MEEIEYLEEYEDLVLPAINSGAGTAANANTCNSEQLDNDGSSSSLDQDIFNCLFDDNSDDDNDDPQQKPLKEEIISPQKDGARHNLDKENSDIFTDLGDQISKELSLENRSQNPKEKDSTEAPRQVAAIFTKSSGAKIELPSSVSLSASPIVKTVATVRPTVQQIVNCKKPSLDKSVAATSSKQSPSKPLQSCSFAGRQPSVSAKSKFSARHQTKSSASKQRPATIVKPEKIITKDPAEDPLNVDASSPDDCANYSVSDISGETYNTISDFDDDDDDYGFAGYNDTLDDDDDESVQSQVIDISNDSSESRSHIEELRGSTPSPVVSEDRCSVPKLMANREIIKSLLSKKEKPKLLNLINEHDKEDTLINKSNEKEDFLLSITPEKGNNDLPTKHIISKPTVLPANVSEDNTMDELDVPSESYLLRTNAPNEKPDNLCDSTENLRSENKSTNLTCNNGQTIEDKKNKKSDLPNESKRDNLEIKTSQFNMDKQLMEKVNTDRKNSKSFEQSVQAQTTGPCKTNQSPRHITRIEKPDEIRAPILKDCGEKKSSDLTSPRVQKKRFRNLKTPEGNYKEVSEIPVTDRKYLRPDADVESKSKEKSEQNVSASVLKTSKQVNLESQTSHSKKDKIQERSIEELNRNKKDSKSVELTKQLQCSTLVKSSQSQRTMACSVKLDKLPTPISKEVGGKKDFSELTSAQLQRKRFKISSLSKGSNEEECETSIVDSKCDRSDAVSVPTVGVTGNLFLPGVESKTKEKSENKDSASVLKTLKEASLESPMSQAKISKKYEQSMEGVQSDKKYSKSFEQSAHTQTTGPCKSNQSPKTIACAEKLDEAKKPILREARSEKETPKVTSPLPQRKRFRNSPKGNERSNDRESELRRADNKCDRSEFDSVRDVEKTRNSCLIAVESKTKEKTEQNISTSVLPKNSFKNPTKFDLSNRNTSNSGRSCERLTDSSRDILNKHVIDVPKGVKVNPFVQRSPKSIIGSKDSRSKPPGDSPRNNSRESSVESTRSSTKDHCKDYEKSVKSVQSETVTHTPKEHPKKSCEKSDCKPHDKVVDKNKSKEIDTKSASPLEPTKRKDIMIKPIHVGEVEIQTKYPSTKNVGKKSLENVHKGQKTSSEKKGTPGMPSQPSDDNLTRSTDEKSQQSKESDKSYVRSKTLPDVDIVVKFTNKDNVDTKGDVLKSQKQFPSQRLHSYKHDLSKSQKNLSKTSNARQELLADVSQKTPSSTFKKSADADKDCTKLSVRKESIKLHSEGDVSNKVSSTSDCKTKDKMEMKTIAKEMETSKSISSTQLVSPSHSQNAVNQKPKEKDVKPSTEVEEACRSSTVSMESEKIKIIKSSGKPTPPAPVVGSNILEKAETTVEKQKQLKTNSASATKKSSKEISETSSLGTKETLCEGSGKIEVKKATNCMVKDADTHTEIEKLSKNSKSEIEEQVCGDTEIKQVSEKPATIFRKSENLPLKMEAERIYVSRKPNDKTKNSKPVENVCKESVLKGTTSDEKQDSVRFKDNSATETFTNKAIEPKAIESRQGDQRNNPLIYGKKDSPAKQVEIACETQMFEKCHDADNAKKNNKLKKKNNLALGTRKENVSHKGERDAPDIGMEKNKCETNSTAISLHSNTNVESNKDLKPISGHRNEENVKMFEEPLDGIKSEANHVKITCTAAETSTIMDIKNPDSNIEIIPTVHENSKAENTNVDGKSVKPQAATKGNTITTPQKDGTSENTEENVTCSPIKSVTPNIRKTRSSKPDEAGFCEEIKISSISPKTSPKDVVTENMPSENTKQFRKTSSAADFNKFEKDQLEKQLKTESLQKALAETSKVRVEMKQTAHAKSTVVNENVDGPSVKPKETIIENTVTTPQYVGTLENTEENVTCMLNKSVIQTNRKTRRSKPDAARFSAEIKVSSNSTTAMSSKDGIIGNTPASNRTEIKTNPPPVAFDKFKKDPLEKHNDRIPPNVFAKTNTLRETELTAEDKSTDQFTRITRNAANTDNEGETKVQCKPLKTVSSKHVNENIQVKNIKENNKNPATEIIDTSQIDQLEKQSNNESPTEAFAITNKLSEIEPQEEGKNANQCIRITRSSATTEDEVLIEAHSIDGVQPQSPYNLKTNESAIKISSRTLRKNRTTPSKGELLGESSQTQEPILLKGKSQSRDESTQGSPSIATDTNRSPQKRSRISRCILGSKEDVSCKSGEIEHIVLKSKHGDVLPLISANMDKTTHSPISAVKKPKNKTLDVHLDQDETSKMHATQIIIKTKTSNTDAVSSTLCSNVLSTKCKSSGMEDANNKERETISKKEIKLGDTEAFKNSETLTPLELTTDCAPISDSKLTDETNISTNSGELLDTVNSSKEVQPYFTDHARRLRKRGSEWPHCENRDGDNTATFKTPTILTGTEVKPKRRLRSPAAEKEVQPPLAKKMKIDKGKARNRNPDVLIVATSESSSNEFTGTSKLLRSRNDPTEPANETTSVQSESDEVVTPLRDHSSVEVQSTEITSQISTTFVDTVRLGCDNSPQCLIDKSTFSHAETKEQELEPEWLKGNDKNDSSQMNNISDSNTHNTKTELEITIKSTSLPEARTRTSVETMTNQVTKLDSNVAGQVSPIRSRKLKSASTHKDAHKNELIENVANISEKPQESNSLQSRNIQGSSSAHKVTEIVPEKVKKSLTKMSPSTETAETSPKRDRKLRIVPRERNNKATSCCNVMANKNELVASVDSAQDLTKQTSDHNTSRLVVYSDEKAKGITKDSAIPPHKLERRVQMKSRQMPTLVTPNKDQQKIKGIPLTKQDKKPNKKSEIEILIESMSKEMKDAGIRDLLNDSTYKKRPRVVAKRLNTADLPQSIIESSVVNPPELKVTKANNDCGASSFADDILKRSQTRRSLPKKLANTKNSNQSVSVAAASSGIEMEKTLIDEVEIKNMNTNLMEPQKYEAKRPFCPSNVLTLKTRHSLPENNFKLPKMITGVNRENTGNCSKNFIANRRPTKCRKLRVKINRGVVKKYFEHLRQLDLSNCTVRLNTQDKSIQRKIIEPTTFANTCAITVPIAREHHLTKQQSGANSRAIMPTSEVKENSNKAVEEPNFATLERDLHLPKAMSIAVTGSKNCSTLYTATDNVIGDNSRNVENILAESLMEPTVPMELKNEFLDENPNSIGETTLPDTPTLIARSQTITQAAANALSSAIIPTDIRLLTNDPISTRAFVPSFGVTPTLLDARGARMYTFLHPAKYNRSHGNVLLDYCCPNLDGPMPAIDPTRIHAQVQTPVIELPAYISLTTKVVTRAELKSKNSTIPDIIRKRADKIRNNILYQSSGANRETPVTDTPAQIQNSPYLNQLQNAHTIPEPNSQVIQPTAIRAVKYSHFPTEQQLSPTVNALAKYLPSTTTITAKIRPPISQIVHNPKSKQNNTSTVSVISTGPALLNEPQKNLLRSNLTRVDANLKSLVQAFEKLNFAERLQVIDNLVASGKLLPKDVERVVVVTEEYLKQINLMKANQITDASSSSNIVTPLPRQISNLNPIRMPTLKLAPKLATTSSRTNSDQNLEEIRRTSVQKVQATVRQQNAKLNTSTAKQRQVPIYDTEKNIIGYQLQVVSPNTNMPSYRKPPLLNAVTGGSSTSLGTSSNTQRTSLKRPAQDSPRIFYTSQPIQTSTPTANLNSTQYSIKPMLAAKNAQGLKRTQNAESIMTTSAGTEKITTTTMATVKRVTRSRAAGSKVIIVSKSNCNEETILPDVNHQAEIKHETDIEDFIG